MNKVALIIGHNDRSRGAYSPILLSEFKYWKRIADKIKCEIPELVDVYERKPNKAYVPEMNEVLKELNKNDYKFCLELHFNASLNRDANGCEYLVYWKNEKAKELATDFMARLQNIFGSKIRGNHGIIEIQDSKIKPPTTKAQLIQVAASIAMLAHWGQLDKAGNLYFDHCRRVALKGRSPEEVILGFLHDVIEDTTEPDKYNYEMLRDTFGFPEDILKSLQLITRDKKEPYFDYIRKLKYDPLAKAVKLHDIEDHLTYGTQYIPDSLVDRYKKAKQILEEPES